MTQSFEILSPTQRHKCECYKKLQAFGVPLYIPEENDLYTESQKVIPYENAFQLPGFLEIKNVSHYPKIEECELSLVFEQMAQVIPVLSDFEQNVLSFWILDVFIEGLWTAQSAKMNQNHQKATLLWIAYFFNYIQEQNPSRRELFNHLKVVLFGSDTSDESIGEIEKKSLKSNVSESEEADVFPESVKVWNLPLPPDLSKSFNDFKSFSSENYSFSGSDTEGAVKSSTSFPSDLKEEETDTRTNLKNMKIILEILYRIFARLWVYMEIQTVFNAMPPVEQVDLPFTLNVPKPLNRPEPVVPVKAEKGGKKPSFSEKSLEGTETERQLHKNDYILPLQAAEESKLYLKQVSGQPTSDRSMLNRNREDRTKK